MLRHLSPDIVVVKKQFRRIDLKERASGGEKREINGRYGEGYTTTQ